MSTNRILGVALLILGVVLVLFGLNATEAPAEEITEAFTGRYSDRTMWYLVGGAVSAVVGLALTLKK
ncbi:MAG: DUF3185 family protein [Marinicella sp.]|nr:DUF3185 family protein [Xanthomonadales bacterium]